MKNWFKAIGIVGGSLAILGVLLLGLTYHPDLTGSIVLLLICGLAAFGVKKVLDEMDAAGAQLKRMK